MSSPSIITAEFYLTGELADPSSKRDALTAAPTGSLAQREACFVRLVDRHSRLMFCLAFSLLRNKQDAEDAVQEAFLKLYRGDAWQRMEDEKAFLARTVWRVALDRFPKRTEQPLESAAEPTTNEDESPESTAVKGARAAELRRLIGALPENLRHALVLSAIEDLNSREIAEILGIPEGTVRTRLMRARIELKRRFEASVGRAR